MIETSPTTFEASDGYPLHVLSWPADGPPRASVVVLHGVQSHAGWYHELGRNLATAGLDAWFPDRRGSGANRRDRGHCPSPRRLYLDVVEFVRRVRDDRPGVPVVLSGISWGGKLAALTAARHPELIDGLALICPGLTPRVGVSAGEWGRIAWAYCVDRRKTFPIPLGDPALFTGRAEWRDFIANDPLSLREATAGLLAASLFIDLGLLGSARRIRQPTLLMLAGRDRIVDNRRTRAFFERLANRDKILIEYPEAHHTLEFEPDPGRYARDLIGWIDAHVVDRPGPRR